MFFYTGKHNECGLYLFTVKGTVCLDKEWLPAGPSLADGKPGANALVAPPKGWPWLPGVYVCHYC